MVMVKQMFFLVFFGLGFCSFVQAQVPPVTPESQQFYYSPKGMSFVPSLTKPGLIYKGQLYTGKASLDYLISKVNVPECQFEYEDYKRNRTWASILTFVGTATSIVGLIGTNENRKINWYLLGGGILVSGTSAILNAAAAQHLRAVAVNLDQQNNRTGMIQFPKQLGLRIPLKY
jgi:hypothetical protein